MRGSDGPSATCSTATMRPSSIETRPGKAPSTGSTTSPAKSTVPFHPLYDRSWNHAVADTEITCLIADDHEVVREGLRLSLSRAPQIRVVGEAHDGASAVAVAERRRPQRRDHGRPHARNGRARGDQAPERAPAGHGRPHLHRLRRAEPARTGPRGRRQGLHPQGGAAPDAPPRDREGRERRGLRRSRAHARPADARARGDADRSASARSCSCSPTACRTPTSPSGSSSARRR